MQIEVNLSELDQQEFFSSFLPVVKAEIERVRGQELAVAVTDAFKMHYLGDRDGLVTIAPPSWQTERGVRDGLIEALGEARQRFNKSGKTASRNVAGQITRSLDPEGRPMPNDDG